MTAIAATPGYVVFTPKADDSSYFYESFACQPAITDGYNAIEFTVVGPADGSFGLELQTLSSCSDETGAYNSSWNFVEGLTGERQTINLPLKGWDDAPNYDAIVGLAWSTFSENEVNWSVGNVTFVCAAAETEPAPEPEPTEGEPQPTELAKVAKPAATDLYAGTQTRPARAAGARSVARARAAAAGAAHKREIVGLHGRALPSPTTPPFAARAVNAAPAATSEADACTNLLIDDWESQSRLTFLGYNALDQTSSDDASMASIVVSNNRLLLSPVDEDSYFYSEFGCLDVGTTYGGISFRIKAPRNTEFSVSIGYAETCSSNPDDEGETSSLSTDELDWTFDGTEKLYSFPFSAFKEVGTAKLTLIYFEGFSRDVSFGPMSFYCGDEASEYQLPTDVPTPPEVTQPTPSTTPPSKALVIDTFKDSESNDLGEWHGADEEGMEVTFGNNVMTLHTNDSDLSWYTQLAGQCRDLRDYSGGFLHLAYSGSNKFSIALQQHNEKCDDTIKPYPETWDSLEAARYATSSDIYIPISHFNVNLTRVIGFALKGFYSTQATKISKIEIVDALPDGWGEIPPKLASGNLVFSCTRPNSFAVAIDDGDPAFAARVVEILEAADIPVTFFTVGLPLLDESNGLADIYKDMAARGHQIALHSYTHPPMEGLPDEASIDWEYTNDVGAVRQVFGDGVHTNYFRPPFGTEGARMRQRLAAVLDDPSPYIVEWSIDIEDWLWAESDTPEKQLDAFKRDVKAGGNLMVMHYLYNSTVELLPEFIRVAKGTGKRLMRVDQCLEDPNAPALD